MPALQTSPVALVSNLRALPGAAPHWDHDPAAEQAVLGAILLEEHRSSRVWDRVSSIVSATDFHIPANGLVFEAMARLSGRLAPIDLVTVCAELSAMGRLNTAGGAQYVGTLSDYAPVAAHCENHARIVADHSARRKVAAYARGLGIRAQDLSRPISTTLAGALVALESVPLPGVQAPTMSGDVEHYFATLDGRVPPASPPVPTGVADLDMALRGGFRRGSFLLVGLPGTGKTTLAMQMVASIASTHGPVLVVSKEQTRDELNAIFLANLARLPLAKVIDAREHPDRSPFSIGEFERLHRAANKLHSLPIHVVDPSTQGCPDTVMEIVAIARGMNPRPVFIVIDNLGELATREKFRERDLAMVEKMTDLRGAKNQLKIPILTLAHPNRDAEKGVRGRRLRGSDIAGGAPAERICDGLILMHREDKHATRDHTSEPPVPGCVELYSSKVRGLTDAMYCEVMAISSEHRFAARRHQDDLGSP